MELLSSFALHIIEIFVELSESFSSMFLCLSSSLGMTCRVQRHHYTPVSVTSLFIFQILSTLWEHKEGNVCCDSPMGEVARGQVGYQVTKSLRGCKGCSQHSRKNQVDYKSRQRS